MARRVPKGDSSAACSILMRTVTRRPVKDAPVMDLLTRPNRRVPVPETGSGAGHSHQPVLLTEAIQLLAPRPGGRYLDATFGGGGHTRAILEATEPDGTVLALDADPEAIGRARRLADEPGVGDRLRAIAANFADLADVARRERMVPFDGVLLDLGVSSFQLDTASRGFAFRFDGPLDMRFDPNVGEPAAQLVNRLDRRELTDLLFHYGEEPRARRIAEVITRERERAPITTTSRLAEIVLAAVGGRRGRDTHPATRTFQALRIATNDELTTLERALGQAVDVLGPGGRLVTIAFHSLEDRIVKRFIERESTSCICPPGIPICVCDHRPRLRRITRRAVRATLAEVARNPRSRSAVLRAAELRVDDGLPERSEG